MAMLTMWYPGRELTLMNVGYADESMHQGLFLEGEERDCFDKYRLQLYHKIVIINGGEAGIESMEGKTLLETGCGRGGGINYLATQMKPQYAIGLDMTVTQVSNLCFILVT